MTFENLFYKDFLTKQFLDPNTEDDLESDGTAFVRLQNVNMQRFDEDKTSLIKQLEFMKVEVSMLQSKYFSGTCYGKWKMSVYTRLTMLMSLGEIIARCCKLAVFLGCFDLRKYVNDAVVERD